jgi:hypothetical protein
MVCLAKNKNDRILIAYNIYEHLNFKINMKYWKVSCRLLLLLAWVH